ncbi:MAG TPA: head GIN domain-containing protein [Burkholderiaceae bacterium]|nr:head GIN domain-containing protein [Burkholderiaceae bacterium]
MCTLAAHAATTGSGRVATEARALGPFQSVALRGAIDLVVRHGERETVQVRADDNVLPLVQTVVDGEGDARTLRVQLRPGESIRGASRIEVTVDLPRLKSISSAGSGDITVKPYRTPALSLSVSGSSNVRFEQLEADQFTISIAGSGDVEARGKSSRLEISIAGSGDVRARELAADDASVSIAGSGDASVTARKSLEVSIAGSGDVEYGGGATLTRSRVAGSGSVRQRP